MGDLAYLLIVFAFFGACIALAAWLEALGSLHDVSYLVLGIVSFALLVYLLYALCGLRSSRKGRGEPWAGHSADRSLRRPAGADRQAAGHLHGPRLPRRAHLHGPDRAARREAHLSSLRHRRGARDGVTGYGLAGRLQPRRAAVIYAILRLQGHLPLNPAHIPDMSPRWPSTRPSASPPTPTGRSTYPKRR